MSHWKKPVLVNGAIVMLLFIVAPVIA